MGQHKRTTGKRLAVFTGQYFWLDGKNYSTDEAFVKFVTSFHPYYEKIVFCDAVAPEQKTKAYVLNPKMAEVCALPYFSLYSFWKNPIVFCRIHRVIMENIAHWDVIWLHGPHPVSLMFAYACRRAKKPFFLFIRQNLKAYVGYRNRGLRRMVAVLVAEVLEHIFHRLSQRTLTFAVGQEIFDSYRRTGERVYEAAVSLVSERDIAQSIPRQMPRKPGPIRLLSVGRLDPEKGIIYLIQAMHELVAQGERDVMLSLVGNGTEEERLRREVTRRGLAQHVNFLGYVSYDSHLLDLYRVSDIFILPSLTEGCPQTLFEAMASGVPIVATRVGGIPDIVEDDRNGLLVDPASPKAICEAVERLSNDFQLTKRLISNGLSTVKNHTLEAERDKIAYRIEELLGYA